MDKLTAETITDDQIRRLGGEATATGRYGLAMWCDYALVTEPARFDIPAGCDRQSARQRCADAINAARSNACHVTAETITDDQIAELDRLSLAPHGYIGDTHYWAQLAMQTIPGVRDPARCWLAAAWNARAER